MPNSRDFDHLFNGRFRVEIEGVTQGAFTACDGLEASVDVVRFADGSDRLNGERKRPGRARYANIVLRRGVVMTTELWQWFKAVTDGRVERKSGSIIVCGDDGEELYRYNFFEGWPCRWKSLVLRTDEPGALVEELEIAIEKFERG
ncbi:MAG: phage tail protein [Rubrivivax sp.]|nr:phage tail protein [Rubrivivax sp.]MCW5610758.1 phage tail protein [Rubrivivax sp.]